MKLRRIQLATQRENLRKQKEKSEGTTYASNCGINMNKSFQNIGSTKNPLHLQNDKYNIVYFDLETSGFEATCDILQIAAVCNDHEFNVYITPSQAICSSASKVHNLYNIAGELFLENVKVDTINIYDALLSFSEFLRKQKLPCILAAHNAYFDKSRLINAIISNNLMENFSMIYGFADTLTLSKKELPDRKNQPGPYKLSNLANVIIGIDANVNSKFHDTLYDVQILQKMINTLGNAEKLFTIKQSFHDSVVQVLNNQKANNAISELGELKKVVSRDILKKVVLANITLENLKEALKNDGKEGIKTMLSKKCDSTNKCLITKDVKVIDKIFNYLNNL